MGMTRYQKVIAAHGGCGAMLCGSPPPACKPRRQQQQAAALHRPHIVRRILCKLEVCVLFKPEPEALFCC